MNLHSPQFIELSDGALVLVQSKPNFQDSWEIPSWECANFYLEKSRVYGYLSTVEGSTVEETKLVTHPLNLNFPP